MFGVVSNEVMPYVNVFCALVVHIVFADRNG